MRICRGTRYQSRKWQLNTCLSLQHDFVDREPVRAKLSRGWACAWSRERTTQSGGAHQRDLKRGYEAMSWAMWSHRLTDSDILLSLTFYCNHTDHHSLGPSQLKLNARQMQGCTYSACRELGASGWEGGLPLGVKHCSTSEANLFTTVVYGAEGPSIGPFQLTCAELKTISE